jgi:thiopeptide-type bacteriocin biosynthesis protein
MRWCSRDNPFIHSTFPMTWLSIHLYPNDTQDIFLARALKPFLEQYIWPKKEARVFFVRYHDEKGPHVRIRLKGEAAWIEEMLRPAFEGWFADRGEWGEVSYEPEANRFGGEEALAWAEEHFHISTRVTLDRIAKEQFSYGDAMFDSLRLHLITAFSAGFSRERARWYFGELFNQWLPLFFPSDDADMAGEVTAAFDKIFDPQKEKISTTLDAFWTSLEQEKYDNKQPEWLRWLHGNQLIAKGLGDDLEKALPSLLHLTNNRMGINNQDEVYLNYILSKAIVELAN